MVQIFLIGNIRKRVRWNRRLRILCTLCIGVWRKFHLHFTLMFSLRYYKMVKSLCKSWLVTSGFKNHMRNLNNFRQAAESPKSWNLTGFCPKNTFLELKPIYTEDLSNITFNYFCEDSPNYLCHFWNHKSFLTTQLLCIFLAQTLNTFCKRSPSNCTFSDFPLLRLNFIKLFMSFFK